MSTRYESFEELADKVDWEGGVQEAINGYGISADELPTGTPPAIADAWRRVENVRYDVKYIAAWLDGSLVIV